MEICDSDDQRRRAAVRFIAEHGGLLAEQGFLRTTWRRRAGNRTGPYYLLTLRDSQGRLRSLYLGPAGPLVDEVRAELARLQTPHRESRVSRHAQQEVRRALRQAHQELDQALVPSGLWRKGCEVRGWRGAKR